MLSEIYLLFYMAITAITVGISILMLWLNHTKHVRRPQYWIRFIVYRIMANAVCYGVCSKKPRFQYFDNNSQDVEDNAKNVKPKDKAQKEATSLGASNLVELEKVALDTEALEEGLGTQDSPTAGRLLDSIVRIKDRLKTIEQGTVDMMSVIWKSGNENLTAEEVERIKGEWREITGIINTFSFWVLFTFTIAFILMCIILWVSRS